MRALSAPELLAAWERGWGQPPARQALALLAAASPDTPPEALAELSIGRRDGRLLALREQTFGPELTGLAACPECQARIELNFRTEDVRVAEAETAEDLSLELDDYRVRFRPPNSLDLLALAGDETNTAHATLLARCLLAAEYQGEACAVQQLPAHVSHAVIERMVQADPQADVRLALTCPACGHAWEAVFDIGSFLWNELNAWGQRTLLEVHALASAYGWREADILALSPWRRQFYLAQVGAV